MIKLFATDIDHTLYNAEDDCIPEENIEAIEKLQQQGVTIALASGRFAKSIAPVAKQLHLFERGGYIIANNGARIIRCRDNRVINNEHFTKEQLDELFAISKRIGSSFEYFTDDYKVSNCYSRIVNYDFTKAGCDVILCKDVHRHMSDNICQCAFSSDAYDGDYFMQRITDAEKQRFSFIQSQGIVIDISLNHINKKYGLQKVMEDMKIGFDECATIGDGDNDAPMLEAARISGCVANGTERAKASAKVVVKSDAMGGVAQFINDVILQNK